MSKPQLSIIMAEFLEIKNQLTLASKKVSELTEKRDALQTALISELRELNLTRVSTTDYTLSVTHTTLPQVKDWDAFHRYIKDHDALYLLERRPSATAYRETLENSGGKSIPGVESYTSTKISARKN